MCEGSDRTAVSFKLLDLSFLDSATGPLWRARALPESREKACVAPGLKDAFPYEPTYIMSYHHGVIDGTSTFVIVMPLLELVEAELGGCPVDEAQEGRIAGDEQTQPLDRDMRARLEKDQRDSGALLTKGWRSPSRLSSPSPLRRRKWTSPRPLLWRTTSNPPR